MSIESLEQYFDAIEDPRCSGKAEHRLLDILVIAVFAVIACAGCWDDIALYGRGKLAWLRTFLQLPNGIPRPTLSDACSRPGSARSWTGSSVRWSPSTARRSGARSTMGGSNRRCTS